MASDEVREVQTVSSAMHGAIALLGATVADQEGETDHLRHWTDVYGNNLLDVGASALTERLFNEGPYLRARRLLGEGAREMLVEIIIKSVEETFSAFSAATSDLVTNWTNAHNRVSYRLLELLAEATGKPERELVAELEAWASELDG